MNLFGIASVAAMILILSGSSRAFGSSSWSLSLGGSNDESIAAVQQTTDGGYVVAGSTTTADAGADAWVVKLNADGGVTWQKSYGGSAEDKAKSIQQTADGGYILAGYTMSSGAGNAWLLKLASDGTVTWQKTYGGTNYDEAKFIQQTTDNGYIVAGYRYSSATNGSDAWILKLTSDGTVTWQNTYGSTKTDVANSIQQTSDGGYIVAGHTSSFSSAGDSNA